MAERQEKVTEKGERKADGSVRFSAHSAGNPKDGVMEMVHNLLTYVKSKGRINIESCGGEMCNYRFYNDADVEKLPTFEKIKQIAATAGKTISSNEGVSLCGIGTEVMGLSSRPYADSTVTGQITVVRDGFTYGTVLTFNGATKGISYEIIEPKECEAENSYDVLFKNCKMLSDEEIDELKREIVDTMSDNGVEIVFSTDKDRCVLKYEDFLYRKELEGTDNYEKYVFHLKDGEQLVLEIVDVADLIKSDKRNKYEVTNKFSPKLSGGAFRYKGLATVCRGDMGWKFSGSYRTTHDTRNNIRFDISGGSYIFHELHKESQIKTQTVISLKDIKNEYRETLKIYDEDGEEYDISEISTLIKQFCLKHKTDKNTDKNIQAITLDIYERLKKRELMKSDIETTLKVLNCVADYRMNAKTLVEQVLEPINNKEEILCFSRAE